MGYSQDWYFIVSVTPPLTIATVIFFLARKRYPIADRSPAAGLSFALCILIWFILWPIFPSGNNDEPCGRVNLLVNVFIIPLGVLSFVLRAAMLLFRYHITQDLKGSRGHGGNNASFMSLDVSLPSLDAPSAIGSPMGGHSVIGHAPSHNATTGTTTPAVITSGVGAGVGAAGAAYLMTSPRSPTYALGQTQNGNGTRNGFVPLPMSPGPGHGHATTTPSPQPAHRSSNRQTLTAPIVRATSDHDDTTNRSSAITAPVQLPGMINTPLHTDTATAATTTVLSTGVRHTTLPSISLPSPSPLPPLSPGSPQPLVTTALLGAPKTSAASDASPKHGHTNGATNHHSGGTHTSSHDVIADVVATGWNTTAATYVNGNGSHTGARGRPEVSWYTLNHRYMRAPFLRRIIGGATIIFVICYIIILLAQGDTPCRDVAPIWWYLQVCIAAGCGAIGGVSLVVIARRLNRFERDGLGIKTELLMAAGLSGGFAFIAFPIFTFGFKLKNVQSFGITITAAVLWAVTIIYPLLLMVSHRRKLRQLAHQVQRVDNLAGFLSIPQVAKVFGEFVSKIFQVESFAFWTRCQAFKKMQSAVATSLDVDRVVLLSQPSSNHPTTANNTNQQSRAPVSVVALREAYSIHRAFIVPASPFEVNISHVTKQKIGKQLASLATAVAAAVRDRKTTNGLMDQADALLLSSILNVFVDAEAEVLSLMQHNSFQKFRTSKAYRQLLEELENQGALETHDHSSHTNDGMAAVAGAGHDHDALHKWTSSSPPPQQQHIIGVRTPMHGGGGHTSSVQGQPILVASSLPPPAPSSSLPMIGVSSTPVATTATII